jgi:hypothetical protein
VDVARASQESVQQEMAAMRRAEQIKWMGAGPLAF